MCVEGPFEYGPTRRVAARFQVLHSGQGVALQVCRDTFFDHFSDEGVAADLTYIDNAHILMNLHVCRHNVVKHTAVINVMHC